MSESKHLATNYIIEIKNSIKLLLEIIIRNYYKIKLSSEREGRANQLDEEYYKEKERE